MTKLERDIKALTESIAHWRRMKAGGTDDSPCVEACALCVLYFDNGCKGCPIAQDSKMVTCFGTPYTEANLAFARDEIASWKDLAQKEIDYLVDLRRKLQRRLPRKPAKAKK